MNIDEIEILNNKYKEDFNRALDIYKNNYTHKELINLLKNGSITEKQAAVLKLDKINDEFEAKILMDNLTGCDGKIREAVSFRLSEFVCQNPEFYLGFSNIFLDAIVDINGNICRNTINAIKFLKKNSDFCESFIPELIAKTSLLAQKAKTFNLQDGKYKINKEIFKLYWYLETIYEFSEKISPDNLFEILDNAKDVIDYTIREKVAKILTKINSDKFMPILLKIKNDNNYYVKRFNL